MVEMVCVGVDGLYVFCVCVCVHELFSCCMSRVKFVLRVIRRCHRCGPFEPMSSPKWSKVRYNALISPFFDNIQSIQNHFFIISKEDEIVKIWIHWILYAANHKTNGYSHILQTLTYTHQQTFFYFYFVQNENVCYKLQRRYQVF